MLILTIYAYELPQLVDHFSCKYYYYYYCHKYFSATTTVPITAGSTTGFPTGMNMTGLEPNGDNDNIQTAIKCSTS